MVATLEMLLKDGLTEFSDRAWQSCFSMHQG